MSPAGGGLRLILHVGRHKTGTTAIQTALAAGRDALAAQGVVYPRLPPVAPDLLGRAPDHAHPTLARALNIGRDAAPALETLTGAIAGQIRAVPGAETLLLSSEAFQNLSDPAPLAGFAAALGIAEVRVVAYVREYLDYALSSWRQRIQAQDRFQTFSRYAGRMKPLSDFIALWDGVGRLDLAWYDAALAGHGDIVADFLDRTGLRLPARDPARRNASIGGNLLYFRLLACRDARPFLGYAAMARLAAGSDPAFRQPCRIPDALAADLRSASAYNASAAARIGPPPVLRSWEAFPDLPQDGRRAADVARLRAAAARMADPPGLGWLDAAPDRTRFYL